MKEIDLVAVITEVVLKFNEKEARNGPHAYLSIPSNLPQILWHDSSLEELMRRFLSHVLHLNKGAVCPHIAVHEKAKMADLEKFLAISPMHWIYLSVASQGSIGFEDGAKQLLQDFGCRCDEWIGVENSQVQLGTYYSDAAPEMRLILCVQNHKARKKCEILVPIIQRASADTDETMRHPIM